MKKFEYTVTNFRAGEATVRGSLADLVLDALVIPRCGLIPPFAILRDHFRTGGGDGGMSPGCSWEAFELTESDYLDIVDELQKLTPDDLALRHRNPQITGEIRPDYAGEKATTWNEWRDSLKRRGLIG